MTDIAIPAKGTRLPDLDLVDARGESHPLSNVIAGRSAVVFFMRSHTCPVCHSHIRELERLAERGALADAVAIVVTPGGASEAAAVARRTSLPVLASGAQHSSIGLGRFLFLQHSGTFVLDPTGHVISARTSALPTSSFSSREVRAALA
ncbi:peroxiredoxin family protein [Agromyces neolithicus]|uniref:Peroxiredoxin family protein n=2 Tax=Agromyces neolithicus TaxID=269420 RepID=A0ABN2LVV5_9MICO